MLQRKTPLKSRTPMARGTSTLARTPFKQKPKAPREAKPSKLPPRERKAPTIYRSPALMQSARDQRCMCCGIDDKTIVGAHRNEGKGERMKVHDCWIAYLCARCHHELDQGMALSREARRIMWGHAYLMTVELWLLRGIVAGEAVGELRDRRIDVVCSSIGGDGLEKLRGFCDWVAAQFLAGRLRPAR